MNETEGGERERERESCRLCGQAQRHINSMDFSF